LAKISSLAGTTGIPQKHEHEYDDQRCTGGAEGDPSGVVGLGRRDITRDLRVMQTFTTFAFQGDVRVTEDTVDKVVHGGLFKATTLAGFTAERARPFDLLSEEFANIYTAVLAAYKPSWDAATFDFLTRVRCRVGVISSLCRGLAFVQRAVERFNFRCPKLEGTR
jgi:hypothetical protein